MATLQAARGVKGERDAIPDTSRVRLALFISQFLHGRYAGREVMVSQVATAIGSAVAGVKLCILRHKGFNAQNGHN